MSYRVRTHANPLKSFPDLEPPAWEDVFADPARPFHLEIGSSGGSFLLEHAKLWPEINILGAEIRRPLVEALAGRIAAENLNNACVIWGNLAGRLREFSPAGVIHRLYLFFPDPWPKKKHHKRRVINARLLDELAPLMPEEAEVHIMTDHSELAESIVASFENRTDFAAHPAYDLPIRSDWEDHCLRTARPYQKLLYRRT